MVEYTVKITATLAKVIISSLPKSSQVFAMKVSDTKLKLYSQLIDFVGFSIYGVGFCVVAGQQPQTETNKSTLIVYK